MFSFLTTVFHVFSSLIEFFHVGNFLHLDCFFPAILLGTSFLCYCNASATDLKEHFLFSEVFYPTLLPHICHNIASATDLRKFILSSRVFTLNLLFQHLAQPAFIKAPLGVGSSSFNVAGHPTDVWNTDSPDLFESHSVQQKVLAGRFYLCVKALRNTIWTFSKFWTCSLIATYIVKCMFWMKFLMISGL